MANWMTIPQWAGIEPVDLFRREQGPPAPVSGAPQNVHGLIRGELDLPPGPCELRICADDRYMLWLDGAYAGQGPVPAYPGQERYDTYHLEGGRAVTVAVHIYYQGLVNRVWNSADGRFGLWAALWQDGRDLACADESWRCRKVDAYSGPVVGYDTQFLEDFDSRLWPEGWELPGHDCSGWDHLIPAAGFSGDPSPRPVEMLWEEERPPVETRELPGGLLLDFGGEIAGTLALTVRGPAGRTVILRLGEELDQAGRVRFDTRCGCRYEERWTLSEGTSTLHPFDYRAFRYAEILYPPGVEPLHCAARVRCYPMEEGLCTLACPTDELEDIFQICKNAVRWCTQEGYLDCATREKGQYLGDALVTARSQVWLTGSTKLLRKCIRDFMASAAVSPGLMAVAPGALMQEIADYSLLFPLLPLTDYAFTGDKEFLARCYPTVKGMTDAFARYQRPDGLLEQVSEQWNLVDWPEGMRDGYDFPLTRPVVGPGAHNVVNALWYGANLMREQIEDILGLPCAGRSKEIGGAFMGAFYRPDQRLFADSETSAHCSVHANLYPAFFGLLPPEAADAWEALLLTPGRCCGVLPMYFALRGLGRLGRYGTIYRLLTRTDGHGWRNMLREGATACFEAWGKDQKWNTSLCHPWASGPIPVVIEELAGLVPDPDAEAGFRFEPHLPDGIGPFELRVPLGGQILRIKKQPGQEPRLERTNWNAVSEDE